MLNINEITRLKSKEHLYKIKLHDNMRIPDVLLPYVHRITLCTNTQCFGGVNLCI